MSARFGRMQKATALVPLALLSAAWTVSISSVGGGSAGAADPDTRLPDGSSVPATAIEAPASVSDPVAASGTLGGSPTTILASANAAGIPAAALAAYQRAETVINKADASCKLPWQLVAAIGRVESNHGRANGNTLDDSGLAVPGIYGIPLDGTQGTAAIADTDAGQFDTDSAWDRAVGPMQFIPSTWSVVGVDADGDGQRNPQDINDAALASAVYLCSGTDDLSTEAGQRTAVFRYNHSESYVSTVLSVMDAYLAGDFTSIPTSTLAASYFAPEPDFEKRETQARKSKQDKQGKQGDRDEQEKKQKQKQAEEEPEPQPQPGPKPEPQPQPKPDKEPKPTPTPDPTPLPDLGLPTTGVEPVDAVLSEVDAIAQCALDMGVEVTQIKKLLAGDNVVANVLGLLGVTLNKVTGCITGYTTP